MKGIVYLEYRRLGFFAVQTEDDDFTVIEALGEPPSLGDILIGELHSLGGERLFNETTKEEIDVFIQDIHVDLTEAKRHLAEAARGR
ncbi:hypothetical protein [Cohnella sp. 56]|uniref:hypothetical protein n=1 Tax=Cohnella sp. 56 TaxID=3113722 RepID=UPI0030E97D58